MFSLERTLIYISTRNINKNYVDSIIKINIDGYEHKIGIKLRSQLFEILDCLNEYFHLVLFTSSDRKFGEPIMQVIDPNMRYFKTRLYRENCIVRTINDQTLYLKDIRVLEGVDLKDIVIIDHSIMSFAFLLNNGIPIFPFALDSTGEDNSLEELKTYLLEIKDVDDMRDLNRNIFKLEYYKNVFEKDSLSSQKDISSSDENEVLTQIVGIIDDVLEKADNRTKKREKSNKEFELFKEMLKRKAN